MSKVGMPLPLQCMVSLKWEVPRAGCIQVFYNCAQCGHDNGATFK